MTNAWSRLRASSSDPTRRRKPARCSFRILFVEAARAMPLVQRQAHGGDLSALVDHVFPPLPVRQWVLCVPNRLRWSLEREPGGISAVLHILLRVPRPSCAAAVTPAHMPTSARLASSTASAPPSTGTFITIAASSTGFSSSPIMSVIFRNPFVLAPPPS